LRGGGTHWKNHMVPPVRGGQGQDGTVLLGEKVRFCFKSDILSGTIVPSHTGHYTLQMAKNKFAGRKIAGNRNFHRHYVPNVRLLRIILKKKNGEFRKTDKEPVIPLQPFLRDRRRKTTAEKDNWAPFNLLR